MPTLIIKDQTYVKKLLNDLDSLALPKDKVAKLKQRIEKEGVTEEVFEDLMHTLEHGPVVNEAEIGLSEALDFVVEEALMEG